MEFWIGAGLALGVGVGATLVGLDRERAFYTTVMLVVASLYTLFAVLGGSSQALRAELLPAVAFIAAAIAGFKRSMWFVAAALAGHGLFDLVHGRWIDDPGVPAWWPGFCGAYDVVAAAYLALLLARRRS